MVFLARWPTPSRVRRAPLRSECMVDTPSFDSPGEPPAMPALTLGEIAEVDVLEAHPAEAAGVELERDVAVERLRRRVGEVDHQRAVQPRRVAATDHAHPHLVPVGGTKHRL